MISELIDNLNEVLDHLGDRDEQLSRLITTFRTFVGGLKDDREAILGSLDQISELSVQTADLVAGIRAPFVEDIKQLRRLAANIDEGKAELDRALQVLPIKLKKVGRTAIYGSWFNFYLCHFQGRVRLPGGRRSRSTTTPAARGVISDEHSVPRAQPRGHRGDQPRRHRAADPGRVPRPGPAADRRRRHLLRRVHRVRRPQGQRRGPDRRRPGRQGRDRRARRRPRQGHLPGQDRLRVRRRDPRRDQGQDAARRDVPRARAGRRRPARGGRRDPGRAHQLAVRRRRGVLRPRRDLRADRHRPARRVADHARRPDPQHPRGVPRRPRRASRPCRPTSPPATTRSTRC